MILGPPRLAKFCSQASEYAISAVRHFRRLRQDKKERSSKCEEYKGSIDKLPPQLIPLLVAVEASFSFVFQTFAALRFGWGKMSTQERARHRQKHN